MKSESLSSLIASRYAAFSASIAKRQAAQASPTTVRRPAGGDTVILSREAIARERAAFIAQKSRQEGATLSPTDESGANVNLPTAPTPTTKPGAHLSPNTPDITNPKPKQTETPVKAEPRLFGQSTLDLIGKAFGTRTGEEGFSLEADANGDGLVNFSDHTYVLANWGKPTGAAEPQGQAPETPSTFGQATLDAINAAFGARTGDDRFSANADANGDGVVNFSDQTHVLANWGVRRS